MSEAQKEAREEAERRWPERYDTTSYTGKNEQRARRAGFAAGAEWQASRAPQPTEGGDYDSELAVMLSQMVDDEPMWSCVVIAKRLHAAGFRRAPAEPAVTDEMVERATHAAYMAGLGSYLNMFALEPKIRAALEAALSTERNE